MRWHGPYGMQPPMSPAVRAVIEAFNDSIPDYGPRLTPEFVAFIEEVERTGPYWREPK